MDKPAIKYNAPKPITEAQYRERLEAFSNDYPEGAGCVELPPDRPSTAPPAPWGPD